MHSWFFTREEKEAVAFIAENCWTHSEKVKVLGGRDKNGLAFVKIQLVCRFSEYPYFVFFGEEGDHVFHDEKFKKVGID